MDDGVRHRGPNTEPTVNATPKIANRFDNNKYNTRKALAKGLLDVALLSSNINNLKRLLRDQGTDAQHPLFEWVMGGLLLSVCLQVSFVLAGISHLFNFFCRSCSSSLLFLFMICCISKFRFSSLLFYSLSEIKMLTRKRIRTLRCNGTIF